MPERSHTSRVPLMYIPFARKSFCHGRLTHTHMSHIGDDPKAVRVFTQRHTHRQKDGSDSMTSTADAGGKN